MQQYLDLQRKILESGVFKGDRTGTGTKSIFGHQMHFDLLEGFPLLTTKHLFLRSIIHELLWFLMGNTNIAYLKEHNVSIWDNWADEDGELGPIYGKQWRNWPTPDGQHIDQIQSALDQLRADPDSRRIIVCSWNVADIAKMALPPCHLLFQFYSCEASAVDRIRWARQVDVPGVGAHVLKLDLIHGSNEDLHAHADACGVPKRELHCQSYQRSCDVFLGLPFNIASYALLTMMVAQVTGHIPRAFVWSGGDTHLYTNHLEQARLQITREPRSLPTMRLNSNVDNLFSFTYEDFALEGYDPHPHIKGEVAV